MRILLVEDDALLGDGIKAGLAHLGFEMDWVRDGVDALNAVFSQDYAAVVLDLGLPRMDGLSLLRRLRGGGSLVPVIILTACDTKQDKLSGLDGGADDYVVKPVDLDELAARLRALIRRASGRAAPQLVCGEVTFDPAARRVWLRGEAVELSARELAILEALMENAGRVMSRAQLEGAIYGWGEGAESNTVEVYVHYLRKKFGADFIRTLRGVGYMIERPEP
jgi:DNA-binding response OmpR family regulator